jgi:YbbR domain-containing protein
MGEKKAEFSFSNVPLVLLNTPSDLVITEKTTDRLSVRVAGSRTVLSSLSSGNLKASIDLEGVKPGTTLIKNLVSKIKLPNGTRITSISPAELLLTLEPLVTKKLPVHLMVEGEPEQGYEVSRISVSPEFVEVRVAKSEVQKLEKVMTEPLDISGTVKNLEKDVSLMLDEFEPPRFIDEDTVTATVTVTEKIIERELTGIPITVVNDLHKTEIVPTSVGIKVKGPYHQVKELSEDLISASIDAKGFKPGQHTSTVKISLPENVSVLSTEPERFRVIVSKKGSKNN